MANSQEELDIMRTVLDYARTGTTHMEPSVMHNPVSRYTDPQRLQQEIEVLFRQFPIILGHINQLPTPGHFFTRDDLGIPILVTRSRDGTVQAFLNVCRHRGARLTNDTEGTTSTFTCPYHGWSYGLDGKLRGLRQPEGFDGLNKSAHGLVALPTFVRFGLIWVCPTPRADSPDIDAWLAPMAEQLGSLQLESHVVYKQWSVPTNMGWRIALEGFQESYHFCTAHRTTACSAYLDNQSVFTDHHPHLRHSVPLSQVTALLSKPEEDWEYRPNFMTQNYLFPCNFAQVMTDHVYIHTIAPTGNGTCVFNCLMLIPQTAQTDKARRYWEANYEVVRTVFGEDFAIGEGIQAGFTAGANDHFLFGRYEAGLQLGQRAIEEALDGTLRFE